MFGFPGVGRRMDDGPVTRLAYDTNRTTRPSGLTTGVRLGANACSNGSVPSKITFTLVVCTLTAAALATVSGDAVAAPPSRGRTLISTRVACAVTAGKESRSAPTDSVSIR